MSCIFTFIVPSPFFVCLVATHTCHERASSLHVIAPSLLPPLSLALFFSFPAACGATNTFFLSLSRSLSLAFSLKLSLSLALLSRSLYPLSLSPSSLSFFSLAFHTKLKLQLYTTCC
jgi:hypothetical protein